MVLFTALQDVRRGGNIKKRRISTPCSVISGNRRGGVFLDTGKDHLTFTVKNISSSFGKAYKETRIFFSPEFKSHGDMIIELRENKEFHMLLDQINKNKMNRYDFFQVHIPIKLSKLMDDGEVNEQLSHIQCDIKPINLFKNMIKTHTQEIMDRVENLQVEGSGLNIMGVPYLTIKLLQTSRVAKKRIRRKDKKLGSYVKWPEQRSWT